MGKYVGMLEPPYTTGRNKKVQHRQSSRRSRRLTHTPQRTEIPSSTRCLTATILEALLTRDVAWKQPNAHRQMDGQRKYGIQIKWNIIPFKEEGNPAFVTMWMNMEDIMK